MIQNIYSFDLAGAIAGAREIQRLQPDHPLGYLLEGEATWWEIWCTSAEFKYGLNDARHRGKLPQDQNYLDVAARVVKLAEARLRAHETAEMHFYAGMGEALAARLYGLRLENRNTARAGVRAREHFLRAFAMDPLLGDAEFGLGLYNYYIDTLSSIAKVLRFFMGIPGGSKQAGIDQLERVIHRGVLTNDAARFYLAMNLCRYDRQYERARAVIAPLTEKYPGNPIFALVQGDFFAKLNRKEQAAASYRRAVNIEVKSKECRANIETLVRQSLAVVRPEGDAAVSH